MFTAACIMELEYIDNKKTMCWSKPDAVFADRPVDDPVEIPNFKELPKIYNIPRDKTVDDRNAKNVLASKKRVNRVRATDPIVTKADPALKKSSVVSVQTASATQAPHQMNNFHPDSHPPLNNADFASSSQVHSSLSASATLKDLCAEDKQRIANLIQELARLSADKEKSQVTLAEERKLYETQIKKLLRRHDSVLTEKQKLQDQYLECFKIVLKYQENLASASSLPSGSTGVAKGGNADARVDRDAQTDSSREDDTASKVNIADKDVSSSETQTSPILSRHNSKPTTIAPMADEASAPVPATAPPALPSQLYPRSLSPPHRQHYGQPPQTFRVDGSRVFSNFRPHPVIPPYYPPEPIQPATPNAVPLQLHRPHHYRLPPSHQQGWLVHDRSSFHPEPPYFVPIHPNLPQNYPQVPDDGPAIPDLPPQMPSVDPSYPNSNPLVPPVVHPTVKDVVPSVTSPLISSSQDFATPPLHQDTVEPSSETRLNTAAANQEQHGHQFTNIPHSDAAPPGIFKKPPPVAPSAPIRRKVSAASSKSRSTPAPIVDEEDASSESSTFTADPESSTGDSASTLRHLPIFQEGDSREKLMEIREALRREQAKLESKLTKQETYIRKKERELKRLAGKEGNKKRRGGKEDGDDGVDSGLKNNLDVPDVGPGSEEEAEMAASLNSRRSKTHRSRRSQPATKSEGEKPVQPMKSKDRLVDLVESLESTESHCASWSQPLKSSTMIGEGGNLDRGREKRRDHMAVLRKPLGSARREVIKSSKDTNPNDRRLRDASPTRETDRQNSSDQENELLDDIFFLH